MKEGKWELYLRLPGQKSTKIEEFKSVDALGAYVRNNPYLNKAFLVVITPDGLDLPYALSMH